MMFALQFLMTLLKMKVIILFPKSFQKHFFLFLIDISLFVDKLVILEKPAFIDEPKPKTETEESKPTV